MSYNPQIPPQKDEDLLPFINDELGRVALAYNDIQDGIWGITQQMPERIKPGMTRIFDGVTVNPEATGAETVYFTDHSGSWKGLAPLKWVSDQLNGLSSQIANMATAFSDTIAGINGQIAAINTNITNIVNQFTAAINSTPAYNFSYANGWSGPESYYRRYAGGVDIVIRMVPGTVSGGTRVATLPVGFRPTSNFAFPVAINNLTGITILPFMNISTAGDITVWGIPPGNTQVIGSARIPLV